MMKDSAWLRLIIINTKYTMKNLSLILKKYIFQNDLNNEATFHA